MKQQYLYLIGLSLLSSVTFAQPTLHQDNGFEIGSVIHVYVDVNPSLTQGSIGPNKTWDFSSLVSYDPITDFSAVSSSSTPFINDFPHAEVATVNLDLFGNDIYNYFTNEIDHYSYWGYESATQKLVYSNPRDLLRFPFTYGDTFTDTYYGMIPGGFNSGVVELKADGYGTLVLPTGIFYNCLRVREIRRDTLNDLIITTTNDTSFKFYVQNFPEPLCQVNHHHSSDGTDFSEIYWQDVQPSGISTPDTELLSVFPNPCHEVLEVMLFPGTDPEMKVRITDVLGREISLPDPFSFNKNSLNINTASLAPGIYFLTVEMKKNRILKRFVRAGTT